MALGAKSAAALRWRGLSLAVLSIGVFFRFRQYFYNRSIWLDEASLANNVVGRPVNVLLSTPLGRDQGAPLGFLLLAKCATWLLGTTDLALRSVPLIAGLLAPVIAFRVGLTALRHPLARLCFVSLVSFAPVLVYYSSEFKQYSGDVTVALLIVWAGSQFRPERWRSGAIVLALVGTLGIWFSHPGVFVLAGVGAALLVETAVIRPRHALLAVAAAGSWWLTNLAAVYCISLHALARNDTLVNYWSTGYAPWPITSGRDLTWYREAALGLVYLAFRQEGLAGIDPRPEWFAGLSVVLVCVTIAGMACQFRHSRLQVGFLVVSIGTAVAASILRLYPFRSRLVLFLVPLVFLAASALVDLLAGYRRWGVRLLGGAVGTCLVGLVLIPSFRVAMRPHNHSDIKGAMAYMRAHRAPEDQLALSPGTQVSFAFYARQFGLENMPTLRWGDGPNNAEELRRMLCRRDNPRRTWIMISHGFRAKRVFLPTFRTIAQQMDSWEGDGAGVYLFDFSRAKRVKVEQEKSTTGERGGQG